MCWGRRRLAAPLACSAPQENSGLRDLPILALKLHWLAAMELSSKLVRPLVRAAATSNRAIFALPALPDVFRIHTASLVLRIAKCARLENIRLQIQRRAPFVRVESFRVRAPELLKIVPREVTWTLKDRVAALRVLWVRRQQIQLPKLSTIA